MDRHDATLGELLRRYRLLAGLSQEELAERARLSPNAVGSLERGTNRKPYPRTIALLAAALGLTADQHAAFVASSRSELSNGAGRPASAGPRRPDRAGVGMPSNLPIATTSFVGRARELAEVTERLQGTRLLTLTGTGGCGKTRLALQVTASLREAYPDGVWFVDLAPIADPTLVPPAVAAALGVREIAGRPLLLTVADSLRGRDLLLLLDNCEHVVDACAHLVDTLLHICPRLRVLATSREVLGASGETIWRVPSLSTPDPRHLPPADVDRAALVACTDAIRLFEERARQAVPDFRITADNVRTVASICHRLDGIPLAIEFAAARVRVLGIEQIADRLNDRFRLLTGGSRTVLRRHQTMRAALDWSYDLLDNQERRLFRRLAVFSGGWTLEAAEAVGAGENIERGEVLDLLARLVDTSLARAEEQPVGAARYDLLETLRLYARELLWAGGEAEAVSGRHAGYYLALAEAAWQSFERGQATWRDELERERENLRAALRWLVESGDAGRAIRLALILAPYCLRQGYVAEGRAIVHSALALARTSGTAISLADVLYHAANFAYAQGDYGAMRAYHEEGVAHCRALGDREGIAGSLSLLSVALRNLGDYAAAQVALEEALALHRALGDRKAIAGDLVRLGELAQDQGDSLTAQHHYEQSGATIERLDELDEFTAFSVRLWHHLGSLALDRGEVAAARAHFVAALRQVRDQTIRFWTPSALADFAALAAAEGQPERAVRLAGAVERMSETIGATIQPGERRRLEHWLTTARQALAEKTGAAWAVGQAMSLEQAVAYALSEGTANE
jgi:non-specific serine/threonine protein kinase